MGGGAARDPTVGAPFGEAAGAGGTEVGDARWRLGEGARSLDA